MASSESNFEEDKYRSHIYGDEEKNTRWSFGAPPNYDVVNKLFEQGRTKEWPKGSLEEKVQRLVKTMEMELFHKTRPADFKSVNLEKFRLSLNGQPPSSLEEMVKLGGYNILLQTSLPENFRAYNPSVETSESSHQAFTTAFPRGFALEILQVYTGPPVIALKFRHWAYMEGPFKGHGPTGEMVEFYGIGINEVEESMRVEKVEFFYDPGELLGQLLKGPVLDGSKGSANVSVGCPFFKHSEY